MRRIALTLLTAAVLAVPGSPANAVKFTSGELVQGTWQTLILLTPTFARQRLDIGIREGGMGTITVGDDRVDFGSQDFVPKQDVTNVSLPAPGTYVLGGLVITGGNDKKVKHKVP